jgi:hypothetical protein
MLFCCFSSLSISAKAPIVFLHASTIAVPSHHSGPQLNVVSFTRDLSLESPFSIQARSIRLRCSHPPMRHTTIFLSLYILHRLSPCLNPLPMCHPRVGMLRLPCKPDLLVSATHALLCLLPQPLCSLPPVFVSLSEVDGLPTL